VAAGFVPGHFHDGAWTVTDHDAHTWVEVWFRGYGWLPFDPTPGRGRLSGTYSSTSPSFNVAAAARLLAGVVTGGEVFGRGGTAGVLAHDPSRRTPRTRGDAPQTGSATLREPSQRRPSLLLFLLLLGGSVAGAIVVLKHGRRRFAISHGSRRIATACARELAEYLQDQRLTTTRAATLREVGSAVAARFGVDAPASPGRDGGEVGPCGGFRGGGNRSARELRRLKRKLRRDLARTSASEDFCRSGRSPRLVDVVVMAAGEGTRLRPLTERWAKPCSDRRPPVLAALLRELAHAELRRVWLVTGHLAEQVELVSGTARPSEWRSRGSGNLRRSDGDAVRRAWRPGQHLRSSSLRPTPCTRARCRALCPSLRGSGAPGPWPCGSTRRLGRIALP